MADRSTGHDALSRRLRELRAAAALRQVDAAELSGISQPTIARFEKGRQIPRPDQVEKLCEAYRAPGVDRRELVGMARDLRHGIRRVVMRREVSSFQRQFGRILAASALVRTFSPNGIPGLLQTAEYCRALFHSPPKLSHDAAEEGIAARLANQAMLDEPNSPRQFVMLLTEGSLGWALLPPAGMADQIDYIAAASSRPNVRVGIIPWGRQSPVLPLHSWQMYDERAVLAGTTTATALLTERADVDAYLALFAELEQLAVYDDAARQLLSNVAATYQAMS